MGKDYLKPQSKAWKRRQAVHAHNGLMGSVGMAKQMCNQVDSSVTTTEKSKVLARKIWSLVYDLGESLKTRAPWKGVLADAEEPDHK